MGPLIEELPHDGFLPKFRGLGDHLSDSSQRPPAHHLASPHQLSGKMALFIWGPASIDQTTSKLASGNESAMASSTETAHPVPLELLLGTLNLLGLMVMPVTTNP